MASGGQSRAESLEPIMYYATLSVLDSVRSEAQVGKDLKQKQPLTLSSFDRLLPLLLSLVGLVS
eukprot:816267-Prorocentrum_lima.AAC.1